MKPRGAHLGAGALVALFACVGLACYTPDFEEMRRILDDVAVPEGIEFQFEHVVGAAYPWFGGTSPNVTRQYECARPPDEICATLGRLWGQDARRIGASSTRCRYERWAAETKEHYRLFVYVKAAPQGKCRLSVGIVRRPNMYDSSD